MLNWLKRWLMLGEDIVFPEVDSRILVGGNSTTAATEMFNKNYLLTYPLQLAPVHADCVRVIFARGTGALTAIYNIAFNNQVGVVYDSILTYGTQGIPIIPPQTTETKD